PPRLPRGRPAQAGEVLMSFASVVQIGLYFVVLLSLVKPLGAYMARVYEGRKTGLEPVFGRLERLLYRICGVRSDGSAGWQEMSWKTYAFAMLAFNLVGFVAVYLL